MALLAPLLTLPGQPPHLHLPRRPKQHRQRQILPVSLPPSRHLLPPPPAIWRTSRCTFLPWGLAQRARYRRFVPAWCLVASMLLAMDRSISLSRIPRPQFNTPSHHLSAILPAHWAARAPSGRLIQITRERCSSVGSSWAATILCASMVAWTR